MDYPLPSSKYRGEQHDRHGGKLHWPGVHGVPYRGEEVPLLQHEEYDVVPVAGDFQWKTFDLSIEEDEEYYRWVMDRIHNGLFMLKFIKRKWNPDDPKNMLVYVEWTQNYAQVAPKTGSVNGDGTHFTLRSPSAGNGERS